MNKVIYILMLCAIVACSRFESRPSEAAIDATLDREGTYTVTDMIWKDDPSATFDLNGDGISNLLFEEINTYERKSLGKGNVSFSEFVDGKGMAYEGSCRIDLPIQHVRGYWEYDEKSNNVFVIDDKGEIIFRGYYFTGSVNQDGLVSWEPAVLASNPIETSPLMTIAYDEEARIIASDPGRMEVEFVFKAYLPQSGEFRTGMVLMTLERD